MKHMGGYDVETHEKAVLLGLVTAAHIARQVGWSFPYFLRAVLLSWDWKPQAVGAREER
jgi:hypothetical protein